MTDSQGVQRVVVSADEAGQRLDNFLLARLKGVPRSHIYKILRSGEVRVNRGRAKPRQKLAAVEEVRIPPIRLAVARDEGRIPDQLAETLRRNVLFEDDALIAINKPAGLAVHGGSGVSFGLIEAMRQVFPNEKRLELVHRLDRDTSGCILLARDRNALVQLQQALRDRQVEKVYQALCVGKWPRHIREIDAPLDRSKGGSGERIVRAKESGKPSKTFFQVAQRFANATLLEVRLESGRTHQIRVHSQLAGHPLAGDTKYGRREDIKFFRQLGLKRMFLHASRLQFVHPVSAEQISIDAPLPQDLSNLLDQLSSA